MVKNYTLTGRTMRLKLSDVASLNMIVEALARNGYTLKTSCQWKLFPEKGIDYFVVEIMEDNTDG